MNLTIALLVNIVAMVALLAGLAHTMSHPKKLKPHVPARGAELSFLREADTEERRAA
jgi:hypothetical protein